MRGVVFSLVLSAACLRLAQAVGAAAPALASDGDAARVEEAAGAPKVAQRQDGRRTIGRLPANLGRSALGVFHADNLVPLLVGGTGAAAASFADDEVTDSLNSSGSGWGKTFETAGGPIWGSLFTAAMFTAGRFSDHARFRALTYDMVDAVIVNFAYSEVIKAAVGRERPNGENDKSLPSGHASNAFTIATIVERHYGWKLGVPAYAIAGVVGASRIQQDKHYVSDVVAGATLGYIVGRTVVRVNSRPLERGASAASLQVSPILGRRTLGVQLVSTF
ncbi:MAG TPA: phosphatase PAP2 family protein [Vicinamibacteria bacterium]|nr:phosphatase PAP2 family protein [Vicinamibacteria bacterium]